MPTNKNLSIAHKWFEAFNNKNIDQLLSLYDEYAEHFSPRLKAKSPDTNGIIKGKKEMQTWWETAFEDLPTLQYKVTSLTANSDRVFMEYIRSVEGENDLLMAEVLDIKEGMIVFSRVYLG
jgi:ketosteroid isomerase-like protein